jgi:hypothetical protein
MRTTTSFSQCQRQCIRWMTRLGMLVLSILASGESIAYDNTRDPPFQAATEGRRFGSISVHPDGEQWLITETVMGDRGELQGIVWQYHVPTKSLRQYQLPTGYRYGYARFSPTGRYVLMVRYPLPVDTSPKAFRETIVQSEIVMMNTDGTGFQVLPIPRGRIFMPVMSPDESKVAFWLAKKERPPGERTILSHFTVLEFDIQTGSTRPFSGPFEFYEFHSLDYTSDDEIMIGAYGLFTEKPEDIWKRSIHENQIYTIKRSPTADLKPVLSIYKYANRPTRDYRGNVYFEAEIDSYGISIVRKTPEKNTFIWRVPRDAAEISKIYAAPRGEYLLVLYVIRDNRGTTFRARKAYSIAMFDLKKEVWTDVAPPFYQSVNAIQVHEYSALYKQKFFN